MGLLLKGLKHLEATTTLGGSVQLPPTLPTTRAAFQGGEGLISRPWGLGA